MKQQQNFLIFKDHYFVKKRKIVQIQVLSTHAFFITWLGSVFYLKMRRCYSYLPFQKKNQKKQKQTNKQIQQMKVNVKKSFYCILTLILSG